MSFIIIADSHSLCREALCDYLRQADPDNVIDGVEDFKSLCQEAELKRPDLILIDHDLPGMDKDATAALLLHRPELQTKIGMIVSNVQNMGVMDSHIRGIFPKNLSCKNFMAGIEEMLSGRPFYPHMNIEYGAQPSMQTSVFRRGPEDYNLTGREREVMSYLLKGASNKDIARALDLQVVTVKLHVRGICRKINAANRTQAAIIAKENGWG